MVSGGDNFGGARFEGVTGLSRVNGSVGTGLSPVGVTGLSLAGVTRVAHRTKPLELNP